MELTITKDKILEAASKCPTAQATLKVLFPEVFENKDESWEKLTDIIAEFINGGSSNFTFRQWSRIPGDSREEKAKWIVQQAKQNLK